MIKQINSYQILELIGSGGMGEVYKANHLLRNEIYAIKSLYPQFCRDEQFRTRFLNEAKIMSRLNDKNIVKVYDYFEHEGGLYIVMEYVEGKPLSRIIGREVGPIPHERAIPLFMQILSGMKHAHNEGVVHRDIKPGNMLVTATGDVKITDFGIAKMEGHSNNTATGTKLGTIAYMSPEQIEGIDVDYRSDIYSLGITLYEMLAGKQPFRVENTASQLEQSQLVIRIITEPISDPRDHYPAIPQKFVDVIKLATEKKKLDRIQSIDEFEKYINTDSSNNPKLAKPELETIYNPPVEENIAKLTSEGKKALTNILKSIAVTMLFLIGLYFLTRSKDIEKKFSEDVGNKLTNSGEMVLVKGGTFKMGSNESDDEKPIHTVTVGDFYIGKYEVTQKEWEALMGSNPSQFKGANLPVENVNWNDIQEYIQKLNSKTGKKYRLPTEAEWEYAARGGNQEQKYKYSGSNSIDEVAWYDGNSNRQTHEVGQKQPNELGIYDMSGNVWEWCSDWYDANYYKNSPSKNPQGPSSGGSRVLRGGSWYDFDNYCRSSYRSYSYPDYRNYNLGFRLVQGF